MFEIIFYQTLEYVIAPIGLMIFLFFVKNVDAKDKLFAPDFAENGIESLFIASYSHILYYFSITAHNNKDYSDPVADVSKVACLMSAIFGLICIFILKYYLKIWGLKNIVFKIKTNSTAISSLIFLLIIIIYYNNGGWNFTMTFDLEQVRFIIMPHNLLYIITAFMLLYFSFYIVHSSKQLKPNINSYLSLNFNNNEPDLTYEILKIGDNKENPIFVRINSLVEYSKKMLEKRDIESLKLALSNISKAKALAIANDYPEYLLYVIMKIKIEIHKLLNDLRGATNEVNEMEKKNENESDQELAQIRKEWIHSLYLILNK